jgi:sodium transport system ATP-binding protein
MLEIRNLHKRFGNVHAVRGLSFDAADGAITGLLGANGAGKTTTLGMIGGVVAPDEGSIAIDGRQVSGMDGARRAVGGLLDHKGLYPRLTARENIRYFGELYGVPARELDGRVDEVISVLGLGAIADRRAAGFSQGERLKVALGRAIVHSPRNLLLDEPTAGLDVPGARALRALLRRMRERQLCIVFSSHVLDEVASLCDTIAIVSEGRIVARGAPAQLCRDAGCASLEDAFMKVTGREEA